MSHLAFADARGTHCIPPRADAKAIIFTSTAQRQPHAEAGSRRAQVCVTITHLDGPGADAIRVPLFDAASLGRDL
ncbi:conserved hypothetical protein,flavin-nucleotide-binding domain (fragment) [Ralstonia solanacearum K60]